MTRQDFERACQLAEASTNTAGIGRLGEKSVHAVLKFAYEPHVANHEIPLGGYVADIVGESGVIEIQSRDLWRLAPKLQAFLEFCDVTVVHPLAAEEWIVRTDPDTGEVIRRKSPRKAIPFDILAELTPIRSLLHHPRFHIRLAVLQVERYDIARTGSRKKIHLDRRPLDFLEEICLDCAEDYRQIFPDMGSLPFTAAEFAKKAGRSVPLARNALLTLLELGLVSRAGKRGRLGLYQMIPH
ncbi:MAG: hypothetical protein ACOX6P_04850 [Candidatus Merdivicinus sp.]|jgi:hypothetical protein